MNQTIFDDQLAVAALEAECSWDMLNKGVCRTFEYGGKTWTTIGGWWKPNEPDQMGGHCWEVVPAAQYTGQSIPWDSSLPDRFLDQPAGAQVPDPHGQVMVILPHRLEVMTTACQKPRQPIEAAGGPEGPVVPPPSPQPEPVPATRKPKEQLSLFG